MAVDKAATRRLRFAVVAVGLIGSACSTSVSNADAALPPAPEVRDVRSASPSLPDDGLLRLTVTVPDADHQTSDREDNGNTASIAGTLEANGDADPLRFDDLIGVPPDSTLTMRGDVLGYLGPDGTFVPLSTREEEAASGLDLALASQAELVSYLRELPGVVTVQAITSSTFAVSASSTDALDALGLDVAEDAFLAFSTDPYEPYQWALENDGTSLSNVGLAQPPSQSPDADVDGLEARGGSTGRGVVVAVVDAGVDFSHPDLTHARWINPSEDCSGPSNGVDDDNNGFVDDCGGWDFGDEDATPFDGRNDEHGTHVAGIIAAKADNGVGIAGIAPDVEIMDLKVNDASGVISTSSIARAIRYATDNGADVVNLSLGTLPGATLESVAVLGDAVQYANTNGVLLVAAAGNSGISLDNSAVYPASFGTPNLLVVGASTSADRRAPFSNTGTDVDLFAPGDLILSTVPGGDVVFMSGTSQASPIVAATAALLLEGNGDLSPSAVIDQVVRSADQLDSLRGLAANPVRLNSARIVGIEADLPGPNDSVTIRGLGADDEGQVSASVSIGELGGQFNQPFHWEASLLTLVDGDPFAVVDHPVTVRDVDGDELRSTQTDRRGAVLLAADSSREAEWSTVLPPGSYAFLVEAVPRTDATARLGDAFVARFDVGHPADESNDSAAGSSSGSVPNEPSSGSDSSGDDNGLDPVVDSGPVSEAISPGSGATGDGSSGESSAGGGGVEGSGQSDDSSSGDGDSEPLTGDGDSPEDVSLDEGGSGEESSDADQSTDLESSAGSPDSGSNPGSVVEPSDDSSSSSDEDGTANDDGDVVELGPDEGAEDGWSITSITPRTGQVDTKNLVTIDGSFPEPAVVWFGEAAGEVIFGSENSLLVETPLHALAETVDVSLQTRSGEVLRLPDAYSFVPLGSDPAIEENESTTNVGSDDSASDEPTFDDEPVDQVDVNDPPPAPGGDDGDDGKGSGKSRNRQARADVVGEPRVLPNGLTVAPMSGLETIGGVPACNEELCRTRRV